MPKKVEIVHEAFALFRKWMERRGFRLVLRGEFQRDFVRLGLVAPRQTEGREIGFRYNASGLEVRVWTTYLDPEGPMKSKDEGWVLIKDGDRARYYARPMHRTKHFLRKLFMCARVAQIRIQERPHCPKCEKYMRIAYGSGLKSRYWECRRTELHADGRFAFRSWDYGLSEYPKAFSFVKELRKKRLPHQMKMRADGKRTGTAVLRRKSWRVTKPWNLE